MNKKILAIIIIVFWCITAVEVLAKNDKNAERSDYRAFIDYTPIDSYIIDGYTYIDAKELVDYGFNVEYNDETSIINITRIRYATPIYSRKAWKNSTCEKKSAKIEDTNISVCLEGNLIDCVYADGKILIMIDNLASYGKFNWSQYEKTVSVTIFQHELEQDLDRAGNVVEMEYDAGITFFKDGIATYKGQVNEEKLPDGIGIAEFKHGITEVKYLGYFTDGKPDGLVYKETFHTVTKSYVHRYTYFIGEIDGSKESKREYVRYDDYNTYTLLREPNFGVSVLPIKEIPEWTGPETMPDRTFYSKGCYYEKWDGRTGKHEYRIWYDGKGDQIITDMCFAGGADSFYGDYLDNIVTTLKKENNAIKYVTEVYEYKKQKFIFRDGYIHTVAGEPITINSSEHGARPMMPKILVYINKELLDFKTDPIIENSRVLVPARAIFEKLGAEVLWDQTTRTVMAVREKRKVTLQINNTNMYLNNELCVLDTAPVIINDTTMVPVRAISEAFLAEVNWNRDTKEVEIFVP